MVVTSLETSRASIPKGRYLKSATPSTSHITINVATIRLAPQQLEKNLDQIVETLTLAMCACMWYKQTSASFQVTAGCVVAVAQGTEMKIDTSTRSSNDWSSTYLWKRFTAGSG